MMSLRYSLLYFFSFTFLLVNGHLKYLDEQGTEQVFVCTDDAHCAAQFGEASHCAEEACHCEEGAEFKPEEGKCVTNLLSRAAVGQFCTSDRDCDATDSLCMAGKCACPTDFLLNQNRTKCLPLAKELGWGCEEDPQCTTLLSKTTECRDNTCGCKSGTVHREGKCVESKGLDAFCESSTVCTTDHSECSQGVCACSPGHVAAPDNSRCLEEAQGFKAKCEESIQCSGPFGPQAACQDMQCVCTAGHHFAEMQCWKDKGLSHECSSAAECYIPEDGTSQRVECVAGQCLCRPGFETDLENMRCSGVALAFQTFSTLLAIALHSIFV